MMLEIKLGERVVQVDGPDAVTVKYLGLNREGHARLGLAAPRRVPIMRRELLPREAQPAAASAPVDRAAVRGEGGGR
jgi:sRNA-binding carbon storage regulator CsrA